jgi:hypothetical protein
MSQWKNTDAAGNSVLWAPTSVKLAPNSANRDNLYENTTPDAFTTGQTVGQFGVDVTEVGVTNGSIVSYTITFNGSGYSANAVVTVSGNATSNATANSTGRISAVNVNTAGSGYTGAVPTVTVAAPAAQTFNSNTAVYKDATFNSDTGVANTTDFITTASAHGFSNGDLVQYRTSTGNTALTGLTNAASYYVRYANSTAFKLSTSATSANLDLTAAASGETGHTLRRVGQGYITLTGAGLFLAGDYVTYAAASGNTALTGLTSGSKYYIVNANSTVVALSATKGGNAIVLTPGVSETGHSITGETATAAAVLSYTGHQVAHAGWVLRTVGTGGRAGRVQYETLVAMGSMTGDSDDTVFKDA